MKGLQSGIEMENSNNQLDLKDMESNLNHKEGLHFEVLTTFLEDHGPKENTKIGSKQALNKKFDNDLIESSLMGEIRGLKTAAYEKPPQKIIKFKGKKVTTHQRLEITSHGIEKDKGNQRSARGDKQNMEKILEDNQVITLVKGLNFDKKKSNREKDSTDITPGQNHNLDQLCPKIIRAQGENHLTSQEDMTTKDFPVNSGL